MGPMAWHDTIFAPITALGGAVAVVRVTGPEAGSLARKVCCGLADLPAPRKSVHVKLVTRDDALLTYFPGGESYTGDETVEIAGHGSRAAMQSLLDQLRAAGGRMARPGEFTERAFLNGRMDLTQAEGVRDLIAAETEAQLRQAALHRDGVLRNQIAALRVRLARHLAAIEATIDFAEEIGDLDRGPMLDDLVQIADQLRRMHRTVEPGRLLREGVRIAILGEPNVGKSSLLNALLRRDRALVTPIPGTTRDYLEESVELDGVKCVLIDTAGLRQTQDPVERLGIDRSHELAASADLLWLIFESGCEPPKDLPQTRAKVRLVANKCDLRRHPGPEIAVSATSGAGLDRLIASISPDLGLGQATHTPLLNPRHGSCVSEALSQVELAASALRADVPLDLAAVGLRGTLTALAEVEGIDADGELLDHIFATFCIGK